MVDGYTQTYGADETSEVVIDLLVVILIGFVGFGTLIALVFLWNMARKSVPALRGRR